MQDTNPPPLRRNHTALVRTFLKTVTLIQCNRGILLLRYKTRQAKRHCTLNEEQGLSINTFYIHVHNNVECWANSEDLNPTGQMLRRISPPYPKVYLKESRRDRG